MALLFMFILAGIVVVIILGGAVLSQLLLHWAGKKYGKIWRVVIAFGSMIIPLLLAIAFWGTVFESVQDATTAIEPAASYAQWAVYIWSVPAALATLAVLWFGVQGIWSLVKS